MHICSVDSHVVLGSDDVMVVIGGFGSNQNPVDVVEKYDPKSQEWCKLPVCVKHRCLLSCICVLPCAG